MTAALGVVDLGFEFDDAPLVLLPGSDVSKRHRRVGRVDHNAGGEVEHEWRNALKLPI